MNHLTVSLNKAAIVLIAFMVFHGPSLLARQGGQHKGGAGNRALSGCMTIEPGHRISSDGGRYCDGEDGVGVGIAFRGGSRLDTNGRGRLVNFDFGDCSDGCEVVPAEPWLYDVDWRIGFEHTPDPLDPDEFIAGDNVLNLTAMAVGDVAWAGLRIDFFPSGSRPNQLRYRLQFGFGQNLTCPFGTSFAPVRIERVADPQVAYKWTISAGPEDVVCLFRVTDNFRTVSDPAHLSLPFLVTLEGF